LKPSVINVASPTKAIPVLTKQGSAPVPVHSDTKTKGVPANSATKTKNTPVTTSETTTPARRIKNGNHVELTPTFDPHEFIKKNSTRNSYDIHVIKKLIGKKILVPSKDILLTNKIKEDAKKIKLLLLDATNLSKGTQKNIIIHVVCVNGIMYVISGYHNYLAINAITYKDIESNEHLSSLEIRLIQLPKVSSLELRQLIEYLV
jgi:hypothetical protein